MKSIDLTQSVMDKVVGFEEKRIKFWVLRIALALLFLAIVLVGSLYFISQTLFEKEVSDLLAMYVADRDTIENVWQEASGFVWDIIPHEILGVWVLALVALFAVVLIIIRKRQLMLRRITKIKQYRKIHDKN